MIGRDLFKDVPSLQRSQARIQIIRKRLAMFNLRLRTIARRSSALLFGPALLAVIGCTGSDLGTLYSVSGTVKYKGQSVDKARINFFPAQGTGHGAHGEVVDGKFSSLTTINQGDGVLAGDYKVTVDTRQVDEDQIKSQASDLAKKHGMAGGMAGQVPQELQAKALKSAKSSIPGKYQTPETSDLTAKVSDSQRAFDFELKD
jgi:hypothetical protein